MPRGFDTSSPSRQGNCMAMKEPASREMDALSSRWFGQLMGDLINRCANCAVRGLFPIPADRLLGTFPQTKMFWIYLN